jgi:hypothetical protein
MKSIRLIAVAFFAVVLALGVSLYWNIRQAEEARVRGQELYKIGLRDGEIFTRNQIRRAELEEQIIADASLEKL